MNARTVKRMLMRGRTDVIWGRRAFLTVRFPISLVTPPKPQALEFPDLTGESYVRGYWINEAETAGVSISKWSASSDPRMFDREPWETPRFVTKDWESHDGRVQSWSFWTGHRFQVNAGDGTYIREPLDEALIAQHKACVDWIDALRERGLHPILDAFLEADAWSATVYHRTDGPWLYTTYSVRCYNKLPFSAALARGVNFAKRSGVRVRVIIGG